MVISSCFVNSHQLFAVLIGINKYKDPKISPLRGAVADADAMCEFLVSDLHVPEDRIVNLRNKQATKSAIIKAIEGLATAPETLIGKDDPILIYYAGHGTLVESPEQQEVHMFLPYDFSLEGPTVEGGQGIYDHTLGSLLANIARSKSDNIVSPFLCVASEFTQ